MDLHPEKKMEVCPVCFCPVSVMLECNDAQCDFGVCLECFESYLDFLSKEVLLSPPKCIKDGCSEWYLNGEVDYKVNMDVYNKYCLYMLNYVCKTDGDVVDHDITQDHLLSKLREKRRKFLNSKFTKPISLVIQIAFKKKLNRIDKRRKKLTNMTESYKRKCMSLICPGHLDKSFKCAMCEITFCDKCEHVKGARHVCNSSEVASISALKDMVSCPKCKTKIERSVGCNGMTCAVCNTSFDYSTGVQGGHGSSNKAVELIDRSKMVFSAMHKNLEGEVLEEVLAFEGKKPKVVSKKPILNIVKKYKTGELLQNTAARNASRAIERYKMYTYKNHIYIRTGSILELELVKPVPDLNKIIDIVDIIY